MNEPKFTHAKRVFSMVCAVEINIGVDAAIIWNILTDAESFPRWNSTVTRIEGQIREGESIRIHVPGSERTFSPKVTTFVPPERMTWTGGFAPIFKGVRNFVLKPGANGSTDFFMEERFSGLMFALVKGSLPDFGPIFESYARDLKQAAEEFVPT